jgi:hypothetical protein
MIALDGISNTVEKTRQAQEAQLNDRLRFKLIGAQIKEAWKGLGAWCGVQRFSQIALGEGDYVGDGVNSARRLEREGR